MTPAIAIGLAFPPQKDRPGVPICENPQARVSLCSISDSAAPGCAQRPRNRHGRRPAQRHLGQLSVGTAHNALVDHQSPPVQAGTRHGRAPFGPAPHPQDGDGRVHPHRGRRRGYDAPQRLPADAVCRAACKYPVPPMPTPSPFSRPFPSSSAKYCSGHAPSLHRNTIRHTGPSAPPRPNLGSTIGPALCAALPSCTFPRRGPAHQPPGPRSTCPRGTHPGSQQERQENN